MSASQEKCLPRHYYSDQVINRVLESINAAITLSDLTKTLNHITPERLRITIARNIYKSRERIGKFTDMSQLIAVPGIG